MTLKHLWRWFTNPVATPEPKARRRSDEVFCRECRHFRFDSTDIRRAVVERCSHPSNLKPVLIKDYYQDSSHLKHIDLPETLNRDNDCPNWESKRT